MKGQYAPFLMFRRLAALFALGILGASCASKSAPTKEDVVSIPVVPYEPTWQCPECSPEEKFVLKHYKTKQESQIEMPWQRSWVTLNKKASSIPTFAREVLEFLTMIAIGVGTDSFSGPLHTVIWG